MNTNNFKIENNGITSIMVKGYVRNSIVSKLIEANKGQRITIWQNTDMYFPCDRLLLNMGTDLKDLFLHSHDFDLLIIKSFVEWCNTKEVIEFLQYLKSSNIARDKKIVVLFNTKRDGKFIDGEITFDDFKIYKSVIEEVSEEIYLFNKVDFQIYKLQDKTGKELTLWKDSYSTLNRIANDSDKKICYISSVNLTKYIVNEIDVGRVDVYYYKDADSLYQIKELDYAKQFFNEKGSKVECLSAESLVNDYLNSFSQNISQEELIKKYNENDGLIIYDFQFLKGKENCIKFIYDLIESFYEKDKQLQIISNCDIEEIKEGMIYRFYERTKKFIIE